MVSIVRGLFGGRQCSVDEFAGDRRDGVGARCAPGPSRAGIATFGDGAKRLAGEFAGRLEVDRRIGAERVLAVLAADAVAHGPDWGRHGLHDEIEARQMAIGDLFRVGAGLMVRPCGR